MNFLRRRDFLAAAGATALAPFVPASTRRAQAQAGFPRRLLLLFSGNGTVESQFWPTGEGTNFTFKPGSITEPLAPYAKKLIFPRGLRRKTQGGGAHEQNIGGLWTGCGLVSGFGYPRGPSLDQVIVQALNPTTTFKSLQFGVQCESFNRGGNKPVLKCMTYSGSNAALKPEDNPATMFAKLMLPAGGASPTPAPDPNLGELARLRARRKSIIDAVTGDLKSLSSALDRDDKQRLEQHLDSISGIEKRLQMPAAGPVMGGAGCAAPDKAKTVYDTAALADNANFPAILDIQNRLAVAALACDRTRIASVQWSRSFSPIRHTWVGVNSDHHTLSHHTDAASMNQLHQINRWYGQRLAELLSYMEQVREGDGTLLDHTVICWGNEAATGNHNANPGITLLAGGGGGLLRTGQNIDCGSYDHSQLLITMAHAVGASSVNHIGDLGMKDGDIPGLRPP